MVPVSLFPSPALPNLPFFDWVAAARQKFWWEMDTTEWTTGKPFVDCLSKQRGFMPSWPIVFPERNLVRTFISTWQARWANWWGSPSSRLPWTQRAPKCARCSIFWAMSSGKKNEFFPDITAWYPEISGIPNGNDRLQKHREGKMHNFFCTYLSSHMSTSFWFDISYMWR